MITLNHWDGLNLITDFWLTGIVAIFSLQIMFVGFHYSIIFQNEFVLPNGKLSRAACPRPLKRFVGRFL